MRKLIDINKKDKLTLDLEAVRNETKLKLYIQDMISDRAKAIRVEQAIAKKPLKKKVVKPKPKPPEVVVVVKPKKSKFNLSGHFKSVEPKIYTNGKCFEVRIWNKDKGVQKLHYLTIEEARKNVK